MLFVERALFCARSSGKKPQTFPSTLLWRTNSQIPQRHEIFCYFCFSWGSWLLWRWKLFTMTAAWLLGWRINLSSEMRSLGVYESCRFDCKVWYFSSPVVNVTNFLLWNLNNKISRHFGDTISKHLPKFFSNFLREKWTLLITLRQEKNRNEHERKFHNFQQIFLSVLKRSSNVIRMLSRSVKTFFFICHVAFEKHF